MMAIGGLLVTYSDSALITGATGVIGSAIAKSLSDSHSLILGYNSSKERANRLKDVCTSISGADHKILRISSVDDISQSDIGIESVSVVVHCAGFSDETPIPNISLDQFTAQMSCSLFYLHEVLKKCIDHMTRNSFGRFINISSVGSISGGVRQAHYACAKAASNSYIRSIANTYGSHGVTANNLAVGVVDSPMLLNEKIDGSLSRKLDLIPVGRPGTPEEIAHVVKSLVSPLSGYINAQTIHLDGGFIPT
jgi:NAD(P)-dependent dehydrogenase (short-subunit alcohol dehydrogenase family)